ncbi:MAG: class I SAM-dependent methyltransferase [Candidatus Omnitrophica bacterium]|nr:class I SAM-dependent methyltransferase [Candidatus Omnitrophota bacterium]
MKDKLIRFNVPYVGKIESDAAAKSMLVNRLIELYKTLNLVTKVFLRARFAIAPFLEIEESIKERKGIVYDLGCGFGMLSNLLSFVDPIVKIVGIDADADKIRIAKLTERRNLDFVKTSILEFDYADANTFVMMDVLHHLPFEDQDLMLKKIHNALGPKGKLYIADVDTRPLLKYGVSRLADFISGSKTYHRKLDDIVLLLEHHGYNIGNVKRLDKNRIVSYVFIECTK